MSKKELESVIGVGTSVSAVLTQATQNYRVYVDQKLIGYLFKNTYWFFDAWGPGVTSQPVILTEENLSGISTILDKLNEDVVFGDLIKRDGKWVLQTKDNPLMTSHDLKNLSKSIRLFNNYTYEPETTYSKPITYSGYGQGLGHVMVNGESYSLNKIRYQDAKKFIETYDPMAYIGRGRICYGLTKGFRLYAVAVYSPLPYLALKTIKSQWVKDRTLYLSRLVGCSDAFKVKVVQSSLALLKEDYSLVVTYYHNDLDITSEPLHQSGAKFGGHTSGQRITYRKYNGKWYSPKGVYNLFGTTANDSIPKPEDVKYDSKKKKRYYWILNPQLTEDILPEKWRKDFWE